MYRNLLVKVSLDRAAEPVIIVVMVAQESRVWLVRRPLDNPYCMQVVELER